MADTEQTQQKVQGITLHTLKSGEVPMVDANGDIWTFPKEHAIDAIKTQGMRNIPADEFDQIKIANEIKAKYGEGAANKAKAFGEGVFNGVAFDAGDLALIAAGVPKEEILAHKQYQSGARGTGEVAGIAGSMLTGEGEEALAAKGLKGAATTEKAAKAAETVVPKAFEHVAPEAEELTKTAAHAAEPELPTSVTERTKVPEGTGEFEFPKTGVTKKAPTPLTEDMVEHPVTENDILTKQGPIPLTKEANRPSVPEGYKAGGFNAEGEQYDELYGAHPPAKMTTEEAAAWIRSHMKQEKDVELAASRAEGTPVQRGGRGRKLPSPQENAAEAAKPPVNNAVNEIVPTPKAFKGFEKYAPSDVLENFGKTEGFTAPTTLRPLDEMATGPTHISERPEPVSENNIFTEAGGTEAGHEPVSENNIFTEASGTEAAPEPATATQPIPEPAPVVPPAETIPPPDIKTPETHTPLWQKAVNVVAAPNKALFGIGKKFGSAVEEASGSSLLGHAASGALESVPYTLGSNASDAELNNEPLTGERLTAGIGVNALLGGTLAAGLGAASEGLHKLSIKIPTMGKAAELDPIANARQVAQSFSEASQAVRNEIHGIYDGPNPLKYQRAAQLLGDSTHLADDKPQAFADLIGRTFDAAEKLPGQTGAQGLFKRAVDTLGAKLQNAHADAEVFRAGDEFKREIAPLIKREGIQNPTTQEFQSAMKSVERDWIRSLEDTSLFGKAADFQAKLNSLVSNGMTMEGPKSGLQKRFLRRGELTDEDKMVFDDGKAFKFIRDLNSDKPVGKIRAEQGQRVLKQWLDNRRDLVGFLKDQVHEPMGNNGRLDNLHESLGANDAKLIKAIQDDKTLTESQKRTLLQRTVSDRGTRLGVAGMLMAAGVPHSFLLTYTVSYALDRMIAMGLGASGVQGAIADHGARFGKVISDGLSKAFDTGGKVAGPSSVGVLGKMAFGANANEPPKERREQALHIASQLDDLLAHPDQLQAKIQTSTKILSVAHPELALQVQTNTINAVRYLASQAPRDPLPPNPVPGAPKFVPGRAETARFEAIAETVANPLVIVRDFANNTLSTEQINAAKAVYPELLQQIQQEATKQLTERKAPLTYQKQLAFERLTGTSTNWASEPGNLQALQQNITPPPSKPSSGGSSSNMPKKSTGSKDPFADPVKTGLVQQI